MALVHSVIFKFTPTVIARVASKSYSNGANIKKSVFISQSKDVYTNLALQDWIYKNFNLTQHHILMLWQNDPCVTIGKKQNPWLEANVEHLPSITNSGVKLARQTTDGHSMYHDGGNLNMTFFTTKDCFNHKYNMELISRALFRQYFLKTDIIQDNIMMRGNYKITENSEKLGTINAFCHCSLMVNVNKVDFANSLMHRETGIQQEQNKPQVKSNLMNIRDENPDVSIGKLLKAIGWEYMRTNALDLRDRGIQQANQQKGFHLINPSESWFPGISKIRDTLVSWDWLYGNAPDFKVTRTICVPDNLDQVYSNLPIEISVHGGIIKNITLSIPSNLSTSVFNREVNVVTKTLIGRKFCTDLLSNLQDSIKKLADNKEKKYASDCLSQVMTSF